MPLSFTLPILLYGISLVNACGLTNIDAFFTSGGGLQPAIFTHGANRDADCTIVLDVVGGTFEDGSTSMELNATYGHVSFLIDVKDGAKAVNFTSSRNATHVLDMPCWLDHTISIAVGDHDPVPKLMRYYLNVETDGKTVDGRDIPGYDGKAFTDTVTDTSFNHLLCDSSSCKLRVLVNPQIPEDVLSDGKAAMWFSTDTCTSEGLVTTADRKAFKLQRTDVKSHVYGAGWYETVDDFKFHPSEMLPDDIIAKAVTKESLKSQLRLLSFPFGCLSTSYDGGKVTSLAESSVSRTPLLGFHTTEYFSAIVEATPLDVAPNTNDADPTSWWIVFEVIGGLILLALSCRLYGSCKKVYKRRFKGEEYGFRAVRRVDPEDLEDDDHMMQEIDHIGSRRFSLTDS